MITERDYMTLSYQEEVAMIEADSWFEKKKEENHKAITSSMLSEYHLERLPRAALYYKSLFPNNYLDAFELDDTPHLNDILSNFTVLLSNEVSERDILSFINSKKNYFLISSLFNHDIIPGHHDAYLFKEFELSATYRADYLLVGGSSGGYQFVFVELEDPNKQITLQDGGFGATIRKGLDQIHDWESWLEKNFDTMGRLIFPKYSNKPGSLPNEFRQLDKSRIHFAVIAGRRKHFKDKTYELKRRLKKDKGVLLLHYDNLIDSMVSLTNLKSFVPQLIRK